MYQIPMDRSSAMEELLLNSDGQSSAMASTILHRVAEEASTMVTALSKKYGI
jgi:hypothetical protein